MVSIVVATDTRGAIGVKNKIPWRIKSDLIRLSNLTRGHPVIVGRKSYDSMVWYYNRSGKPMPGSCYIVVTRNKVYRPARQNARTVHSFPEALTQARSFGDDQIFVIGGGSVFAEALAHTDRVYLTEVQTKIAGDIDAYFPKLLPEAWQEVSREHFDQSEKDDHATELIVFERR